MLGEGRGRRGKGGKGGKGERINFPSIVLRGGAHGEICSIPKPKIPEFSFFQNKNWMWGGGWLFFYKSMGFIVLHGHEFFPGGFKNTEKAKYFVGGMGGFFLREGGKRRKGDSVICDFLGGGWVALGLDRFFWIPLYMFI